MGLEPPAPTFVTSWDLFWFKSKSKLEVKVMDQNFGTDRKVLL